MTPKVTGIGTDSRELLRTAPQAGTLIAASRL